MKTFEELKAEAIERGIVPGAVIACVAEPTEHSTVWPTDKWKSYHGDRLIVCAAGASGGVQGYADGTWATVITPAPSEKQPEEWQKRIALHTFIGAGLVAKYSISDGNKESTNRYLRHIQEQAEKAAKALEQ